MIDNVQLGKHPHSWPNLNGQTCLQLLLGRRSLEEIYQFKSQILGSKRVTIPFHTTQHEII